MSIIDINYNEKLAEIFQGKPELVINHPEWMLSGRQIKEYRQMEHLAIVEIAGRDSVAAAVRSVEQNGFTDLIPVYVYTGTEYGAWNSVGQAVKRLAGRLPDVRIHPLLLAGSPDFWRALNGRFVSELISRYHFFSPCPGCHLYLHAIRIPLAKKFGNIPIVAGERESHSGQVKINQTANALDFYLDTARRFDVRLLFPLRHIEQSNEIERILRVTWEREKEQLECVFSGNYRLCDETIGPLSEDVNRFFEEFACPTANEIIEEYIRERIPDAMDIARRVLDRNRPVF